MRSTKLTESDGVELPATISKGHHSPPRNIETTIPGGKKYRYQSRPIPDLPSSAFQCQSYRIRVPCSFEPRLLAPRAFRLAAFVEKFRPRHSRPPLQS
jgi:hypothetical protein